MIQTKHTESHPAFYINSGGKTWMKSNNLPEGRREEKHLLAHRDLLFILPNKLDTTQVQTMKMIS